MAYSEICNFAVFPLKDIDFVFYIHIFVLRNSVFKCYMHTTTHKKINWLWVYCQANLHFTIKKVNSEYSENTCCFTCSIAIRTNICCTCKYLLNLQVHKLLIRYMSSRRLLLFHYQLCYSYLNIVWNSDILQVKYWNFLLPKLIHTWLVSY